MSALNPAQAALKVVYCYDPGSGVAETKGGVAWKLGNDTTGDGRSGDVAGAPYATLDQALQEVRTFEGQELTTQDFEFRMVTDDDEASVYGTVDYTGDAAHPSTDSFHFILRGWLKSWGDALFADVSGKWAGIAEYPSLNYFKRSSGTNIHGPKRMTWLGVNFTNTSTSEKDIEISTSTINGSYIRMRGCTFNGTSSNAGNVSQANTTTPDVSYTGCSFFNQPLDVKQIGTTSSAQYNIGLINCYFHSTSLVSIKFDDNGGTIAKYMPTLSCIFNLDGSIHAYDNQTPFDAKNNYFRDNNRYWLQGAANFAKWSSSITTAVFAPVGSKDVFASSGDPDFVSAANPALNDTSLIVDKGAISTDLSKYSHEDPSGNKFDTIDALNFFWGDSIDSSTAAVAGSTGLFSQRGVGPIQNARGMTPPIAVIASPKNIISFGPVYLAAKVTDDPDGVGTVQPRFLQASNLAMDTDLVILDAWPLNITAGDNKINFKEDGGAERTATISTGVKSTADLVADIKTALEAAPSSTGTYTVTYNIGTNKIEIAVSGAVSTVQLLWSTGTDVANAAFKWTGFRPSDTPDQASHTADDPTLENFYDAARVYEFSTDYDGVSDPGVSGAWNDLGTGDPSDAGVEGNDGVDAEGVDSWVRTDFNNKSPMVDKFHSAQFSSGTLKSSAIGPA